MNKGFDSVGSSAPTIHVPVGEVLRQTGSH